MHTMIGSVMDGSILLPAVGRPPLSVRQRVQGKYGYQQIESVSALIEELAPNLSDHDPASRSKRQLRSPAPQVMDYYGVWRGGN